MRPLCACAAQSSASGIQRFTDDAGMEIYGMIGLHTLSHMTLPIDYRDGLVKFDYDPKRKGPLVY
jgi:hypothetical protein